MITSQTAYFGPDGKPTVKGLEVFNRALREVDSNEIRIGALELNAELTDVLRYTRAEAEAANINAAVLRIAVDGLLFIRDTSGTALTTGGGAKWSPDGVGTPQHFGVVTDGTDCEPEMQRWLDWALAGNTSHIPRGDYHLANPISGNIAGHVGIDAESGARIIALPGFPNAAMVTILDGGSETEIYNFAWGGFAELIGDEIPDSEPGEANNCLTVRAKNCFSTYLSFAHIRQGDDWLSGNDALIGITASSASIYVGLGQGGIDGIYVSGDGGDSSSGQNIRVEANLKKVKAPVIFKRDYERKIVKATLTECFNGVGDAPATGGTDGFLQGGAEAIYDVVSFRTNRSLFVQGGQNVIARVVATEIGQSIEGVSTDARAVNLSGCQGSIIDILVEGVNPDCTVSSAFRALDLSDRTINYNSGAVTTYSTNNIARINARGIGRAVNETGGSNKNYIEILDDDMTHEPVIVGSETTWKWTRAGKTVFGSGPNQVIETNSVGLRFPEGRTVAQLNALSPMPAEFTLARCTNDSTLGECLVQRKGSRWVIMNTDTEIS